VLAGNDHNFKNKKDLKTKKTLISEGFGIFKNKKIIS